MPEAPRAYLPGADYQCLAPRPTFPLRRRDKLRILSGYHCTENVLRQTSILVCSQMVPETLFLLLSSLLSPVGDVGRGGWEYGKAAKIEGDDEV